LTGSLGKQKDLVPMAHSIPPRSLVPETGYGPGRDGLNLATRTWNPRTPPRAAVVLVHGIGEHSGRYQELAEFLAARGFRIHAFDLRGHGQSPGPRGHIAHWVEYRDDLHGMLAQARKALPERPCFLYGHSLGALIALDHLLAHPEKLAGAVLSGLPVQPARVAPPSLVLAARLLSRIWPRCPLRLAVRAEDLTRDPERIIAYRDDPQVSRRVTARAGAEILATIARVRAKAHQLRLPLLLLHGEDDPLNSAEGTRRFYEAVPGHRKTLKLYPDTLHEPHHDLARTHVLADLADWLESHTGADAG